MRTFCGGQCLNNLGCNVIQHWIFLQSMKHKTLQKIFKLSVWLTSIPEKDRSPSLSQRYRWSGASLGRTPLKMIFFWTFKKIRFNPCVHYLSVLGCFLFINDISFLRGNWTEDAKCLENRKCTNNLIWFLHLVVLYLHKRNTFSFWIRAPLGPAKLLHSSQMKSRNRLECDMFDTFTTHVLFSYKSGPWLCSILARLKTTDGYVS